MAVQSLSGHTSAVESVGFDSTEVFVAAGAASGTIKLWDLEEAKSTRIQIFTLLLICGQYYKYMYESLSNFMLYLLAFLMQLSAPLLDIDQTVCQLIFIRLGNSLPLDHWTLI